MARAENRRLQRRLGSLTRRVDRQVVRSAVQDAAEELAAEIRNRVPVDTGELRNDIRVVQGDSALEREVVAGENAEHAAHVEYGTRHMPARPYMRPAADIDGPRVRDSLGKRIARGIETEAAR